MVIAWLGTASLGMLLARYFKQTWVGRKVAGVDLWFAAHRNLMVLTVVCSVAGLVCVVVQLEGWTTTPASRNPHPLVGVICVGEWEGGREGGRDGRTDGRTALLNRWGMIARYSAL